MLRALTKGPVLGASLGVLGGGRIDELGGPGSWEIQPGFVWSLTVAQRFFGNNPQIPFLLLVGTVSGSNSRTIHSSTGELVGLHALDTKLDLSFGWTIGEAWSPYLAVRGFGGPVFWRVDGRSVIGGDAYHFSVAAGYNLSIRDRVSVYFDGAFVGFRSLGGGLSVRF